MHAIHRLIRLLVVIDLMANAAAFARFASWKTTTGDLPPSSRATSLTLDFAAACMIKRPALVDPVKLILLDEKLACGEVNDRYNKYRILI